MPFPTAHELARRLAAGESTARAITEEYLARIDSNRGLGVYITVCHEEALAAADAADTRRSSGRALSPFDGVPVAVKDNICTRGVKTTCASRMLADFTPPYDACVIERLRAAGLVVLGKLNLDEFAMGSSTEYSAHGPAKNPWDVGRTPGGSSGGSAAAVAAGLAPWTLGSDTGGSIRQPAGFCGVVGAKPTYGRVSRYGLVAFASSLDQIGPLAADVRDAGALLEIISGHDPRDSTSSDRPTEPVVAGMDAASLDGLRIARPREFFDVDAIDPEVKAACQGALDKAAAAGAEIVDVSMPHAEEYAVSTYYVLATAEAGSNLARYDGVQYGHRAAGTTDIVSMFSRTRAEGFGAEVKRRLMLGSFVLAAETFDAYYLRAQKARTLIQRDFDAALGAADLVAAPTSPVPPFSFGERMDDPVSMYLADIFTLSLNLAGYCGLSMPAGFTGPGLPIGLQLFGGAFAEPALFAGAAALERELDVVGTRTPRGVA